MASRHLVVPTVHGHAKARSEPLSSSPLTWKTARPARLGWKRLVRV